MGERKKLSDILSDSQRKSYFHKWQDVKPAGDFIVPRGEYVALLTEGFAHKAKTGTAGIKLIFEIMGGPHEGRKLFHDLWLTDKAKPQTKRDLDALGITDPEHQLDGPVPEGIVVKLTVVVQKGDDEIERNCIRRIKFIRVEPPDPFAPQDADGNCHTSCDPEKFDGIPKDTDPKNRPVEPPLPQPSDSPCGREGARR
jgi:hypothetical protein